jgi:hypothetical protein
MPTPAERALVLFRAGDNCVQAIVFACGDELGVDRAIIPNSHE